MRHKWAVQLYTLRNECTTNFPAVLRELKQMGWAGVQLAGYNGYDPKQLAAIMKETGLKAAGMHVGYDQIVQSLEQIVKDAEMFETKDIICPFVQPARRTEAGYREMKETLRNAARQLQGAGYRISYHNHAFEFDTMIDGQHALAYMLDPVPDNPILAEIDVYWIRKAGFDPLHFIDKYAHRMPIIHLKDMAKDESQAFAEIGTGVIDFRPILDWGKRMESSGTLWSRMNARVIQWIAFGTASRNSSG